MGCDIHLVVEIKRDGKWQRVLPTPAVADPWELELAAEGGWWAERIKYSWYSGRNYELFATLAGVRNRYEIEPIAEPRGLPDDLSDEVKVLINGDGPEGDIWLGDHSHSWLLVQELLDHPTRVHQLSGWVDRAGYDEWQKDGKPTRYCQYVLGSRVVHVEPEEMARLIESGEIDNDEFSYYTTATWNEDTRELDNWFWKTVVPELVKLGDPRETRIVFGFDS